MNAIRGFRHVGSGRVTTVATATAIALVLAACPGAANAGDHRTAVAAAEAGTSQLAGDIAFSVPSGTFQGRLSVSLSTRVANAQIRYTTNGAVPNSASTAYDGRPLSLTTTTQLRAQAFVGTSPTGATGTAIYLARSFDARHDLPLLVMDAYGGGKPGRDGYRDVAVMVMEPHAEDTSLAEPPAVVSRAGFHLRGQSSAVFDKAPYRIELWDNQNRDADLPMLGMPADSDWVLRGPFPDKTLIHDAFAFSLGQDMGLRTPRFAFVELYLNLDRQPLAETDYQGVYLLVETIKRSRDRLDLSKIEETDTTPPAISGGYILQFNALVAEPPTLACTPAPNRPRDPCWSDLEVMEPNDLTTVQQAWITEYVQRFHDALHGPAPSDPRTGYPAYIDVDSFVNRIIHDELSRPSDAYVRSTHFTKDRGGRLVAGPLWDYDLGYGAYTGFGSGTAGIQGWQYQLAAETGETTDWFDKLMQDPAFSSQVAARWRQLRQGPLSDQQLAARIGALTQPLARAAERNFERWPILGTATVGGLRTQVTQSWDEQLQLMRGFLTQRAAWLDGSGWRPAPRDPR